MQMNSQLQQTTRSLQATVRLAQNGWEDVPVPTASAGSPALDPSSLTIPGSSLADRLHHPDQDQVGVGRYEVKTRLGSGANGSVWALFDRNLQRPLAAKVLEKREGDAINAFVQEARITAALEHPNVLPVHEVDLCPDGRPYFTMKRIEGRSLGDAIAASSVASRGAHVRDANAVVAIIVGVANALSYAHHRDFIHQDVKPDNIMLGDFGEVLLVDWGSAQRASDRWRRIYGTPLYMAPEQARHEYADSRSDIYSLGATLFHALTLRLPTIADTVDAFWRKKRAGEIDPVTPEESRRLPGPLLAIAIKAMDADPDRRYQTMDGLLADLRAYQAGLPVTARPETWWQRLIRWRHLHAIAIAIAVPVASTCALLVLIVFGDQIESVATWGNPVVHETFDDPALRRWCLCDGGFVVQDGAAISTGRSNLLILQQRFVGDIRVEYDAWFGSDARLGDLSLLFCPSVDFRHAPRREAIDLARAVQVRFGAHGGQYSVIQVGHRLAFDDARPEPNHRYRVRVEIRDNIVTMAIDGHERVRYVDPLPLDGGYVALSASEAGKHFSNLRISRRNAAQLVPATAGGDCLLRNGDLDHAAVEYARVAESHPGTELARRATYREGLARWTAGDREAAGNAWWLLNGTPWADEAELIRIDGALGDGRDDVVVAGVARLATTSPSLLPRLAALWCTGVESLGTKSRTRQRRQTMEAYLAVRKQHLLARHETALLAAKALLFLERYQDVLDYFPEQRWECCDALIALGRADEVAQWYPEQSDKLAEALDAMGRSAEIHSLFFLNASDAIEHDAGLDTALYDRVLERWPKDPDALLATGRFNVLSESEWRGSGRWEPYLMLSGQQRLIAEAQVHSDIASLMASGRVDEAAALTEEFPAYYAWPRLALGLRAWILGDHARAEALFVLPGNRRFNQLHIEPAQTVILPFLRELGGDSAAFDHACADTILHRRWLDRQVPWHLAHYLAGEIDDGAFLAQPFRRWVDARLLLARAVRCEHRGHPADAVPDYRAYLALPLWRRGDVIDPVVDEFVAWRLATLTK